MPFPQFLARKVRNSQIYPEIVSMSATVLASDLVFRDRLTKKFIQG